MRPLLITFFCTVLRLFRNCWKNYLKTTKVWRNHRLWRFVHWPVIASNPSTKIAICWKRKSRRRRKRLGKISYAPVSNTGSNWSCLKLLDSCQIFAEKFTKKRIRLKSGKFTTWCAAIQALSTRFCRRATKNSTLASERMYLSWC